MRVCLFNRCSRVVGLAALTLLLGAASALAQTGRIEGTVRDVETGDPVANARVAVVGTDLAALTNQNGYYAVENVPVGTYNVRVSVIGYQPVTITNQRVATGLPTAVNFTLQRSILRIEGIVVTGVAERTQVAKLPFTVDQVASEDLPVPSAQAVESIRGKVAGARVIRASGRPGDDISVLLRGPTSITGTNEPLYVVDGVILGQGVSKADIDGLDIETIEVVKGAAAAALYGSRAANGIVQITTRRGRDIPEGETRITARSEFGFSEIERPIPQGQAHWYKLDGSNWVMARGKDTTLFGPNDRALATRDGWNMVVDFVTDSTDWDGDGKYTKHTYAVGDNLFPGRTFDNLDRFFEAGQFYTHTLSVSHRTGTTNFLASFHETREAGVVDGLNGYLRRGARVNVDHQLGRAFDFSASAYYANSEQDDPISGENAFYGLNFYPIDVDLLELDTLGGRIPRDENDFIINPDETVVEANPIYSARNQDEVRRRSRVLGNFRLRWRPIEEFDLSGEFSFDRSDRNETEYAFKGFKTVDPGPRNLGFLYKDNGVSQALNASVTAAFSKQFGALRNVTKARALLERQRDDFFFAFAQQLGVGDVKDLDVGNPDLNVIGSNSSEIRALGYFISTQLDLKDRYIVDALARRDGSSLFGEEERWQSYYRVGGAWRIAEEPFWPFDFIDEFKVRFSQGTAGGRPGFEAQFETYNVSRGVVSKGTLGNKALKPEFATEKEAGLDVMLFGRLSASAVYAKSEVEDQLLAVPLAGYFGFSNQWRNAGTLESKSWEGTVQAAVIQRPDVSWSVNFVIDKTKQKIIEFDLPAYRTGPGSSFFVRRGEVLGTIYGFRWATSCDDIFSKSEGGFWARGSNACLTENGGEFQVNDDGYLVAIGPANSYTEGITNNYYGSKIKIKGVTYDWGFPFRAWDIIEQQTGQIDTTQFLPLGNTQPDFNWGLGNTIRIKGFNIYGLFEAQVGGVVYNNTRQWPCRELNCWESDQSGKPEDQRKAILYYQTLYNVNAVNSHYVEDASYVKLRELSVRYTIGRQPLEGILGGVIKRITLGLVGRNLKTWTDYLGYDPEVSTSGEPIFRFDGFGYPNYRSFTGTVEIEF